LRGVLAIRFIGGMFEEGDCFLNGVSRHDELRKSGMLEPE
jgi:hypothetical protein